MFLVGSAVFAMGAVGGCGDDDDTTFDARTVDAPVTSQIDGGSTAVDARTVDAQSAGG